ncbi:MAG: ANR family transcriptional regulator [Candidatus Phlomobacter fragariae]
MAFKKNDSPLYFKAAQDAVHLEQSGQYREAARAWSQANRLARNRDNCIWSEHRADFCIMQIKRENMKRRYSCG